MKALILVYAIGVLLFAGFARAEDSPARIHQVGVDLKTLSLHIEGQLPNPCYPEPSAVLTSDKQHSNILILRLSSPSPQNFCVTKIKEFFKTVKLSEVARDSRLALDDKTVYEIRTEGHPFSMQVSGSELVVP